MRVFLLIAASAIAILFNSCANQDGTSAKGGVWDETENGVAVLVVDPQGKPVANARVRIIPQQSWAEHVFTGQNTVADSGLTDANGFALLHTTSWPSHLEIDTKAGMAREALGSADSARHITPQTAAAFHGILLAASKPWPDSMRIAGTSFAAKVQSDGSFRFDRLPPGEYSLVSATATQIHIVTRALLDAGTLTKMDSLQLEDKDSVLIDDFEDQISANRFHDLTGSGWWYTSADSLSRVIPSELTTAMYKNAESWHNTRSLHVVFAVDSTSAQKFALCGFDLGESRLTHPNSATYDLSQVDSITFWAKGTGTITMQANGSLTNSADQFIQLKFSFTLDTAWTRIVVKPSQWIDADSLLTWQDIAPFVNSFNFMSNSNADLWLDQIQFHGISAPNLYSTLLRKQP